MKGEQSYYSKIVMKRKPGDVNYRIWKPASVICGSFSGQYLEKVYLLKKQNANYRK